MIRVVVFLLIVGALSLGVAWFADRPGEVVITWQGLRIETSLMVLGSAVVALMAVLGVLFVLLRAIVTSPLRLAGFLRRRRGLRAYEAISRGLIAVGAGDLGAARKLAAEVNRLAPAEPLALLLTAQAAQLRGDREAAERTFRVMAGRPDTKALGLHGLFVEAQRRDDSVAARTYAEEAARTAPALVWAGKAVLEFRCASGDWSGALELLEQSKRSLDRDAYRRRRAVMLTARALAAENSNRDHAKADALEAVKLAPTLVPAAALAGRFLAEAGNRRRASRILARAWRANPHPELAQAYADVRLGDTARDRLKRVESLAKSTPDGIEAALAVARAAIEARQFAMARDALAPHLSGPTRRVALLMAEIERGDGNDEGRAREWMTRALHASPDPQWTADGYVSDRWLPISPITGRLDAFEWRVPLTGVLSAPVIEPEPAERASVESSAAQPEPATTQAAQLPTAEPQAAEPEAAPPVIASAPASPPKPPQKSDAIIPLIHAPDDPGPEPMQDKEPTEIQTGRWRNILE